MGVVNYGFDFTKDIHWLKQKYSAVPEKYWDIALVGIITNKISFEGMVSKEAFDKWIDKNWWEAQTQKKFSNGETNWPKQKCLERVGDLLDNFAFLVKN